MLSALPFYAVLFAPVVFFVIAAMTLASVVNKATAKPKPPAHVDTPEEAAERKARVLEMMAQAEKSRLAHQS